jgi:hypothetical protein
LPYTWYLKPLFLTEPSEIAERKAILGLFIDEIVINPFPVYSVASSEAGERNVFKFLPWAILHFAIFNLNFIYFSNIPVFHHSINDLRLMSKAIEEGCEKVDILEG